MMVASASLPITARNSTPKPKEATTRRERVFSIAARRLRSGAVTRTVSMRGTPGSRGEPCGRAGDPGCGVSGWPGEGPPVSDMAPPQFPFGGL